MKPHILLVDDDHEARTMIAYLLHYSGYRVTQAPDGETALSLLETDTFDVVLTDIVMGDVSGIEVLYTARLRDISPAVILLTGHGTLDTAIAAVRGDAHDYLLKPCSDADLLACIEKAVSQHKNDQQIHQATQTLLYALNSQQRKDVDETLSNEKRFVSKQLARRGNELQVGELVIRIYTKEMFFQGKPVHITPTEHALILYLAERVGTALSCREMVRYTHRIETDEVTAQSLLRSHIRNIRRKIGSRYLVTERGVGYKIVNPYADG